MQTQTLTTRYGPLHRGRMIWNDVDLAEALHVSTPQIQAIFTDGRNLARIFQYRILNELLIDGGVASDSGHAIDAEGNLWRVGVFTESFYVSPSRMRGTKRSFDEQEFNDYLATLTGGVILGHAERFPRVPFYQIPQRTIWAMIDADFIHQGQCKAKALLALEVKQELELT